MEEVRFGLELSARQIPAKHIFGLASLQRMSVLITKNYSFEELQRKNGA